MLRSNDPRVLQAFTVKVRYSILLFSKLIDKSKFKSKNRLLHNIVQVTLIWWYWKLYISMILWSPVYVAQLYCFASTEELCEDLAPVANGTFASTAATNVPGNIVTYSCDEGFELSGPAERTCLADSTWFPSNVTTCGKFASQRHSLGFVYDISSQCRWGPLRFSVCTATQARRWK